MKAKRKAPELVLQSGRPAAVIVDINENQKVLERLEDLEDVKTLKAMRSKPLTFKRLEDFLGEYTPSVSDPSWTWGRTPIPFKLGGNFSWCRIVFPLPDECQAETHD